MVRLSRVDSVGHFDAKKTTRHSIYSIDFQPNGGRLATAGGDCTVKLWNTEYLLSDQSQSMSDSLLATLSTHSRNVNVVRWSSDGRFLASGSDDCYIIVYRYTPDAISTQPYGSNTVKNRETWSRCFTLQGHVMDVLDICWSSRGILASASIDNNIMIWDLRSQMDSVAQGNIYSPALISPFRVLSGHMSFVKGVAFDPIGRYLLCHIVF
jgi:protein HIRA/HIR1